MADLMYQKKTKKNVSQMPQHHGMVICTSLILMLETASDIFLMWYEILHKANSTSEFEVLTKDLVHSEEHKEPHLIISVKQIL